MLGRPTDKEDAMQAEMLSSYVCFQFFLMPLLLNTFDESIEHIKKSIEHFSFLDRRLCAPSHFTEEIPDDVIACLNAA